MQNQNPTVPTRENEVGAINGWLMLAVNLVLLFFGIFLIASAIYQAASGQGAFSWGRVLAGAVMQTLAIILLIGHFTLQPNQARVLILFGAYKGTVRRSGFHWANPFYSRRTKISLRAHNFNSDKLKVNDTRGNPIEIAAVVVWRVDDTAQALFDVVDYEKYLTIQSESAVRHLASSYAYDHGED